MAKKLFYNRESVLGMRNTHPIVVFFLALGCAMLMQALIAICYFGICKYAVGIEIPLDLAKATNVSNTQITLHKILQGLTLLFSFGLFGWVLGNMEGGVKPLYGLDRKLSPLLYLLVAAITFTLMPFNEFTSFDAESFSLPESMALLEEALEKTETMAKALIGTYMKNQLLLNLLIIAVIPAIAEELFFRGFVQRYMMKLMNVHIAIFLSGFIFSLIHFQVFGFIPRMILGMVFGYLFYWSGSLWLPILGHFLNNGSAVIMSYIALKNGQAAEPEFELPLYGTILSTVAVIGLMYLLYTKTKGQRLEVLPSPFVDMGLNNTGDFAEE